MTESEGKALAGQYCSGAEHCCLEVRAMLERHKVETENINRILKYLISEGFIDESRYARAFVHDKVRFAKWGRSKITQALWLKRIPQDIANAALSSIDEEEYMAALREITQSRYHSAKGSTDYERKIKTMKTVCGRGYEPSLVRKVLDLQDAPDIMP